MPLRFAHHSSLKWPFPGAWDLSWHPFWEDCSGKQGRLVSPATSTSMWGCWWVPSEVWGQEALHFWRDLASFPGLPDHRGLKFWPNPPAAMDLTVSELRSSSRSYYYWAAFWLVRPLPQSFSLQTVSQAHFSEGLSLLSWIAFNRELNLFPAFPI